MSVVVALAVALAGTGCSTADDTAAAAPVQINLPDGRQITVPKAPRRVVTLGGQWTDVALSFGLTPVGYYDGLEQQGTGTPPWYGDKLKKSVPVDPSGDLVASVAKLKPDLILAPGFASMAGGFDALTKLAPTIDKISGQQVDPWQDMVALMGTILHRPDEATRITAGVDRTITDVARRFPGLRGKTYTFAFAYGSDQMSVLADPSDGAGKLFGQLGLRISKQLTHEAAESGQPRVQVSTENFSLLDSDLLVLAAQTPQLQKRVEGLGGFRGLGSVRRGAVAMLNTVQITGLNEPSPNSIPYAFGQMTSALAAVSRG
ncbi:ABC transporter substrate-binding protein [Williamsia sterculiae]|uniref:Iron complex transport system substrate-binding protein n=1 Tax=Williamsia sterculiae TaxID=1344003 RepID=A0A1N7FUL0_9NOCA|nr:ABC transporter substrate-binding protein [Williamsia sterculiae]SIS04048.1 iron complex transport system substrate-binding protein [Williamsia sterculiae]